MSYRARLDPIPLQPGTAKKSGDHLFDLMVRFFDDMAAIVRGEVSLVMAAVTEEQFIYLGGEFDYEYAVRHLFHAPTYLRRLGHLINVIAVFDVYFAGDPKQRLGSLLASYNRLCADSDNPSLHVARNHYAAQLAAIEQAGERWTRLRNADLTTSALNAAPVPGE
jgi:hypothetical protein